MAKWRDSMGSARANGTYTTAQENAFVARMYTDGTARSHRYDYYAQDAYSKGWRPGRTSNAPIATGIGTRSSS
jgi:hypothetical protein